MTKQYMAQIKTDTTSGWRILAGWDETFASIREAKACADRARKNDWLAVRVVEVAS